MKIALQYTTYFRMSLKEIIGTMICLVMGAISIAQQDSQFTQYMYNTGTINPSYVASKENFSVLALYRNQWVGIEGAPETLNFNLSAPLSKNIGVGLMAMKDKIGPSDENVIAGSFGYIFSINNDVQLSLGVNAGVSLLNVDYNLLNIFDPTDPVTQNNIENRLSPIIGTGAYFVSEKWYLGLSTPNLLTTNYFDESQSTTAVEAITFYGIGGYVFDLNENLLFKPAVLFKSTRGAAPAFDVSANFLINDALTLGVAHRLNAAVSGLAGFQISRGIMVGYAYDFDTSRISRYNSGSHEVFLRFEIGGMRKTRRYLSPRFY